MAVFSLEAVWQAFESNITKWFYSSAIIYNSIFAITAMFKTFMTEPGKVTPALLDKLKN